MTVARVVIAALVVCGLTACDGPLMAPTTLLTRRGSAPIPAHAPWLTDGVVRPATPTVFDGRLALLGVRLDDVDRVVRGMAWWQVTGDLAGRVKPELAVLVGDEALSTPIAVALHPLEWRAGDVVEVAFALTPQGTTAGPIAIGITDAGRRWHGSGGSVKDNAVVVGARAARAEAAGVVAVRRRGDVVIDGALDEAAWAAAAPLPLRPWKTGEVVTGATTVRFVWDDDALLVGFDVDDDDPFSPYTTRDDPLYESEALEVFIDADGDRDVYVELQASPTNVHFDAAFAGGARKGMDVGWNAPFVTATSSRPGGYTQEWRIPVAALKDIPAGEPKEGANWRVNVFRLERRRQHDRQGERVTATEASALSPPERGDFHALDRFTLLGFRD